jgi:hypothetical protein
VYGVEALKNVARSLTQALLRPAFVIRSGKAQTHHTKEQPMAWLITKYLLTAGMVVLVSEFAKRSDRLGALIAALPLVTVLALIWLHVEGQSESKVANHARYTFWYVLPTLPMFLAFPWLLPRWGFWPALLGCVMLTAACFAAFAYVLGRLGVELW